ncbi:hypothetical protein TNCV_3575461 [Trichonephila clavipes]|nr:hypothetical protein TNCV_3575461 [Trichonephila clavipes]
MILVFQQLLNGQVLLSEWTKTPPLKNVFNTQPIGTRRKGRPNLRWIDGLDLVIINVALFSYTRASGDGPRNFESWSSDVDDT